MRLKAYAKINLSLRVFERRPDGFHRIESLMQSISLCDYVTVDSTSSGIQLTTNDPQLPTDSRNLAYRAAELFLPKIDSRKSKNPIPGVRIHIEKHIPMAAGLAGGSADAAAVLYGLNQMSNEGLLLLGSQIGSDVPFCLTGGTCLVEGRGEKITPQQALPKTFFIIVKPDFNVATKWAYTVFDEMTNDKLQMTNEGFTNDLEAVVAAKYPEITAIKEMLLQLGCAEAQMSGSGSAVFGMLRPEAKAKAQEILDKIMVDYPHSFVVETVNRGVEETKE